VAVYVILRTTYLGEDTLKSYLSRLTITLDAYAVNKQQQLPMDGQPAGQPQELVYSGRVQDFSDPLIIVHGSGEGSNEVEKSHIITVWKLNAFLGMIKIQIRQEGY
jgi:hypothetical protein